VDQILTKRSYKTNISGSGVFTALKVEIFCYFLVSKKLCKSRINRVLAQRTLVTDRQTDRQTTDKNYDNSRTLQCDCNVQKSFKGYNGFVKIW